jgi:UDP-N-acetylglucosamine acyltransferase
MPKIHPSAIIEPGAQIADDAEIGPAAFIGPKVTIGSGTKIGAFCYIDGCTTIGANNQFYPHSIAGLPPEDYNFKGGETHVKIGDGNIFREYSRVHGATKEGGVTTVGDNCFFMSNTHVAHDCHVGNKVIMITNSVIGGHVTLMDGCIISGVCAVHQFCRVGRLAMLSGVSAISLDLPPFMVADGRNGIIRNYNSIGLRRNNFSKEAINAVRSIYKIFFREGLSKDNAIARIEAELPKLPEVLEFLDFIKTSKRGVLRGRGDVPDEEADGRA